MLRTHDLTGAQQKCRPLGGAFILTPGCLLKKIYVQGSETVSELAALMAVTSAAAISTAFRNLGRMLTIHQHLTFDEVRSLALEFGFEARLADQNED